MLYTAKNIKTALGKNLPGSVSHKKMLPKNRVLKAPDSEKPEIKHSSVLLLMFVENEELTACLIKRPKHMKHHAGQIALPGGRVEAGETKLETALRETQEEIGIKPEQIEILGELSGFYVEVSRFQIHPFVGWLQKKPEFFIQKNEVEKTILFPVKNFGKEFGNVEIQTVTGKLKVPCVHFENEIIWGATAMIMSEFYDVLKSANLFDE